MYLFLPFAGITAERLTTRSEESDEHAVRGEWDLDPKVKSLLLWLSFDQFFAGLGGDSFRGRDYTQTALTRGSFPLLFSHAFVLLQLFRVSQSQVGPQESTGQRDSDDDGEAGDQQDVRPLD